MAGTRAAGTLTAPVSVVALATAFFTLRGGPRRVALVLEAVATVVTSAVARWVRCPAGRP